MPLSIVAWTFGLLAFQERGQVAEQPSKDLHGDPLPAGAIARLGTTRLRHLQLSSLGFSPDGSTLASSGRASVRLWDPRSGELRRELHADERVIPRAAFSGDGKRLVSLGSDYVVHVWDAASGRELLRMGDSVARQEEPSLAVSFDGGRVAAIVERETLVVWDAVAGKELLRKTVAPDRLQGLAFSPDGRLLAGGYQEFVVVWSLPDGRETMRGAVDEKFVISVAFSPDGTTLAAGGTDGRIRLFDPASGRELRALEGHSNLVSGLAFAADGKTLVSASWDRTLRTWDLEGKRPVLALREEEEITAFALSPDGKTAAVGFDNHHEIRLWDLSAGKLHPRRSGHGGSVLCLAVSPDGATIATGSWDETVRLWDARDGRPLHVLVAPPSTLKLSDPRVFSVLYSADGRTLVSHTPDAVHFWDPRTAKLSRSIPASEDSGFVALGLSVDGKLVATRNQSSLFEVWDAATGSKVREWKGPEANRGRIVFAPDGRSLLSDTAEGKHLCWDLETGKQVRELARDPGAAMDFDLSQGGRILATGHRGGRVVLWDAWTGTEIRRWSASEENVGGVAVSPDGRLLATSDKDGVVRIWETLTATEVLSANAGTAGSNGLGFASGGSALAAGTEEGQALVWSTVLRGPGEPEAMWTDLAAEDARKGYAAVCGLEASPEKALPFLRERLRPAPQDRVDGWIAGLDDENEPVRARASRELELLASEAAPRLRAALAGTTSPETRARLAALLSSLEGPFVKSAGVLRKARIVQALERIGSREARELLRDIADGAGDAWEVRDARRALERLDRGPGR